MAALNKENFMKLIVFYSYQIHFIKYVIVLEGKYKLYGNLLII